MTRAYLDMVADLFHVGHLRLIKRAKQKCDYLIVGIHSDEDVERYKRKPIISHEQRCEIVESCKYVDEVIPNAPLVIDNRYLEENNIDIVFHGDDITEELLRQHAALSSRGMVEYLPRTKNISTTEIINRAKGLGD